MSLISDAMSEQLNSPLRPHAEPHPSAKLRKSDVTRAAILNAALEFLWSHPFREMSVVSLMASTALSRSAFYQYFHDLHELMESLLDELEQEVLAGASPWLTGSGDAIALLHESLAELVRVCHERGPILRAVADAAPSDERLDRSWTQFLGRFDDAVTARIEADQQQGLIAEFEARPVAVALNRLDAFTFIHTFGTRPRSEPEPVLDAIVRIWTLTLYGASSRVTDCSETPRIRRPAESTVSSGAGDPG
ncbi:MAG: TetR/AcrR family transcriptional regulator [Gemmatimonadota bacterium]|nr:MAG: TetR/AcrR family transcriptional regulator [Gemmatimonadota bacterium]